MQHLQITLDKSALHMNSSTLHENSCYFGLFTCNLLSPYDTSLDFPLFLQKIYPNQLHALKNREKYSCSFLFPRAKIVNKIYVPQNAKWTEQIRQYIFRSQSISFAQFSVCLNTHKSFLLLHSVSMNIYKHKNTKRTHKCRKILTPHFIVDLRDYKQGWRKTLLKS